jgi:hypothetical protein
MGLGGKQMFQLFLYWLISLSSSKTHLNHEALKDKIEHFCGHFGMIVLALNPSKDCEETSC